MLIHQFLQYHARNRPDSPCVSFGGTTWSYGDIHQLSNQFAHGLRELGISKGDRVGILGENSVEHIILHFATAKIGAIFVPFNYRLAPAELEYVVGHSETRLLMVLSGMDETLAAVKPVLPEDIVLMSDTVAGCILWKDWVKDFPDTIPENDAGNPIEGADPYLQLFTSGTTGKPKGVVIAYENLMSLCHMNVIGMSVRPNLGDCTIVCAPLFHIGGLGSITIAIYLGQHILLHSAFVPNDVLDDIENNAVSNIFMVPAMIAAVLNTPGARNRDYSQLQLINYGASPISETSLRDALEVFQCDFGQMYGMTETAGTVVGLSALDHRLALNGRPELLLSCGRPSVGAKAKVVDTNGNDVPAGEIGEIWLWSATNMIGYHKLPEATAECLTDGWVHTGDAGYMDEQGYLYLKDRLKDMVVSGAENIYPVEVENAIAKHDAVLEVAVIGVPDDTFGEALLAYVVLRDGGQLDVDELIEFCRDKIAGYKIPRQMALIDELPRNPSGKILKKILRASHWEGKERSIG